MATSSGGMRVTVTADIRICSDLRSLMWPHDTPMGAGEPGGQSAGAVFSQEFLTVEHAAEVMQVSRDKVYSLIRTGQLRSIKIGRLRRVSRQWIAEFAEQRGLDGTQVIGEPGRTLLPMSANPAAGWISTDEARTSLNIWGGSLMMG